MLYVYAWELDILKIYIKFATQHYANYDSHCGYIIYEIIKYFPTNTHNTVGS